jgi:hypothetical protein
MKELLRKLEENFQARLMKKTGWGRNEIMTEYHKAVIDTLSTMPDPMAPVVIPAIFPNGIPPVTS